MTVLLATTVLDDILAIQLSVAWAREGRCEPKRLEWWKTDLIDEQLGDRLRQLKLGGQIPSKALRMLADPLGVFDAIGYADTPLLDRAEGDADEEVADA